MIQYETVNDDTWQDNQEFFKNNQAVVENIEISWRGRFS